MAECRVSVCVHDVNKLDAVRGASCVSFFCLVVNEERCTDFRRNPRVYSRTFGMITIAAHDTN